MLRFAFGRVHRINGKTLEQSRPCPSAISTQASPKAVFEKTRCQRPSRLGNSDMRLKMVAPAAVKPGFMAWGE